MRSAPGSMKLSDQPAAPRLPAQTATGSLAAQFVDVRWILRGARVFGESGSHWCVIEASTVALPSIGMEIGDWSRHRRVLVRCSPFQGSMRAMMVEVGPEIEQLVFEIRSGPEQRAIQILASNRAVLLRIPLCGVRPDNAATGTLSWARTPHN